RRHAAVTVALRCEPAVPRGLHVVRAAFSGVRGIGATLARGRFHPLHDRALDLRARELDAKELAVAAPERLDPLASPGLRGSGGLGYPRKLGLIHARSIR